MRILLVEDDQALGEGIRTALKPEGYTVDWLQDGASALHALSHESFELAILDLGLPRMDGLQVHPVRVGHRELGEHCEHAVRHAPRKLGHLA
jgi:DNA-binding response OmpR family regulator